MQLFSYRLFSYSCFPVVPLCCNSQRFTMSTKHSMERKRKKNSIKKITQLFFYLSFMKLNKSHIRHFSIFFSFYLTNMSNGNYDNSTINKKQSNFTNLYVKNFGTDINETKLCQLFSEYGIITSCKVCEEKIILKKCILLLRFKQIVMVNREDLVLLILKDQIWHKMLVDIYI